MSAPTRRTVAVMRDIWATSRHCSASCECLVRYHILGRTHCELKGPKGAGDPLDVEHYDESDLGKSIRTQACLDGEIAARGGAL